MTSETSELTRDGTEITARTGRRRRWIAHLERLDDRCVETTETVSPWFGKIDTLNQHHRHQIRAARWGGIKIGFAIEACGTVPSGNTVTV